MEQEIEIINFNEGLPIKLSAYNTSRIDTKWESDIEIIMMLKGECYLTVNDHLIHLIDDDIYLINSNEIYSLTSLNECSFISLFINLKKLSGVDEKVYYELDSTQTTNKSSFFNIKHLIAKLVKKNTSIDRENFFYNEAIIYQLMDEINHNFKAEKPNQASNYTSTILNLLNYIEINFQDNLTLNQLADKFNYSVPYLSSLFKKYLGENFQKYYNNLRLEKAYNDLLHTNKSIEEIAISNGFSNARSFVTIFKEKYFEIPSIYRKKIQTKELSNNNQANEINRQSTLFLITKYLTKDSADQKKQENLINERKILNIDKISCQDTEIILKHNYKKFTSVSRAKELLYSDVQEMLRELQNDIGFEYIKFHGLLSDDMLVYTEDANGNPSYNFLYIDKIIDFLISINLKPLIQFSFMPKALALHPEKTIYASSFILSMPKSMTKWKDLIGTLTSHLIKRYTAQVVRQWLFCVWNEPDTTESLFGFKDNRDFYELYQATYETVKKIDKKIIFGSPSLLVAYTPNREWCYKYINFCKENNCIPDFMNIHYYENDFEHDEYDIHKPANPAHSRLNLDENAFSKAIVSIKYLFNQWGIGNLPIYLTEWNLTVSHRDLLNDTCFKSCYLAKNLLENYDLLDSFGYWVLTDLNEETFPSKEEFHGGLGLFTHNGIKKPHYYTFKFISQFGNRFIKKDKGYFITKSHHKIQILTYNYEHFNHLYAQGETFDMEFTKRYTPFNKLGPMDISLELCDIKANYCTIREQIVNQSFGSAFDEWIKIGAKDLSNNDIEYLKRTSVPKIYVRNEKIENNTLTYHASLEPLEIRFIEIELLNI